MTAAHADGFFIDGLRPAALFALFTLARCRMAVVAGLVFSLQVAAAVSCGALVLLAFLHGLGTRSRRGRLFVETQFRPIFSGHQLIVHATLEITFRLLATLGVVVVVLSQTRHILEH